jgi:ABC-type uncharacterized transport system fused permease/ATPase subunit
MESTGITVEQPPDGLTKLNRASNQNRYQQVHRTDPMTEQKQTYNNGDGIFRDNDDNYHSNKKGGNSYQHHDDSCPMDAMDVSSSSSSRLQNEQRQSIHWSHVYQQITLMFRIALPYFRESKQSRWLVAGLLLFMTLDNGASILFSYVSRDFWNALADQNESKFYANLISYIAVLLIMAPIDAIYIYQQSQFALHWRAWLTTRTIELYSSNQVYYNIEVERNKEETHQTDPQDSGIGRCTNRKLIDNPDQRITEDVQAFTKLSIELCFNVFGSTIQLFSFSAILWSINPQLLLIAFTYALAGTIVTMILGHPLIKLNVEHLRREADLRYSLVRFRENAEAIAFHWYASKTEQQQLSTRLNMLSQINIESM